MIELFIPGTPGPQGSKRIGRNRKTKELMLIESSTKVKPWRTAIAAACFGKGRIASPVAVDIVFVLKRPLKKKTQVLVVTTPDLDKLCRSTFDGLKQAGIILDDATIAEARAAKVYTNEKIESGAFIRIQHINKLPDWAGQLMGRLP